MCRMKLGFFMSHKSTLSKANKFSVNYKSNFQKRLLDFSVNTIKLLMRMSRSKDTDVIRYQLSKSATSTGANFDEAQSSGDREFLYKIRLALEEANESIYWYKIIDRLEIAEKQEVVKLRSEAIEISRILGSTVTKLVNKLPN